MSYRTISGGSWVVTCDLCRSVGPVYSPLHAQVRTKDGQPLHLCRSCRRVARWCVAHQEYHLPKALHRTACATCGGLFTSRFDLGLSHCPSCRRDYALAAAPPASGLCELLTKWRQRG